MRVYTNKEELITEIKQRSQKYIAEFEKIPEDLRNRRTDEVDKTPSENLSYQLGWLSLLLGWKEEEKAGIEVQTLAEGYKWNNLGGLYQSFYDTYREETLDEQMQQLNKKVMDLCLWIETLTDKELFEPEQRKWATTKAKWPLYKWVHINSVAPFTNFRTKIRKWKKIVL
ncbi:ClbS/DfsB family four-helix bundle protein [Lactococcus lactis]|uniref:ClbS/DfsB family four-helix bundle protein n=1 Tax=Lactococcus lactis TaxID=1358 RepID=UPI001F3E8A8E|nr:ClbS/DfsB family four-helix bundle protein [Lactococcus lactis]MCG1001573.1 ClbS/DfsB family four-helix bundle protein [Lactococcus lactis]